MEQKKESSVWSSSALLEGLNVGVMGSSWYPLLNRQSIWEDCQEKFQYSLRHYFTAIRLVSSSDYCIQVLRFKLLCDLNCAVRDRNEGNSKRGETPHLNINSCVGSANIGLIGRRDWRLCFTVNPMKEKGIGIGSKAIAFAFTFAFISLSHSVSFSLATSDVRKRENSYG